MPLSIHDLTRRSTLPNKSLALSPNLFQFTTSQGGRLLLRISRNIVECLSIHDLTRRSTLCRYFWKCWLHLSIHDLTRRSTTHYGRNTPEKPFQFTTSQGGRLRRGGKRLIQLIFQFTTSQGGRQSLPVIVIIGNIFQFTTSQGGRPQISTIICII